MTINFRDIHLHLTVDVVPIFSLLKYFFKMTIRAE